MIPSRHRSSTVALALLALALSAPRVAAQISLTTLGSPVTQNFDALAATGTGVAWTDNSTIPGWYATRTTYNAGAGASNTGSMYSFGTGTATDRALGGVASGGTGTMYWAARYVNNTGGTINSLTVSYTGEQWRDGGNATPTTQPLAFQYQVANAGVITDADTPTTGWVAAAALNFVSPIATATATALDGNAPANRVALSSTVTVTVNAGQELWIRWQDINDTGNDHGLAIDDLSVTPSGTGGTPVLSINDVSVTEGDSGTVLASFVVSLSLPAPAGGVTFDIATQDNTATVADNDYVASALTAQVIPAGSQTFNFDVTVNGDVTVEPNQTFFVNVTNVTGTGVTVSDGQGVGTILNDDVALTAIHDIQGSGASSPIVSTVVTTRGIVTGVKSNGFFIQEPDASVDADPATSEGVLVFTSSAPPAGTVVGNLVQVSGTVLEFVPGADPLQPPLTEIGGSPTVSVLSTGNPLPTPATLTTTFPSPAGTFDQLEALEGMRVSVSSLTVTGPTLGTVNEPNATATSSGVFYGVVTGVPRPFREAGIQAPDPPPSGSIPPIPRFDTNPERIRVDSDGLVGGPLIDVATGALVTNLVGPLDYSFRTYTILPDPAAPPNVTGGATPTAVSAALNTEFTVASFNLERFFDTVDDPGIGEPVLTTTAFNNRLAKASKAIRDFLRFPDILGVVEVENLSTLQTLATTINNDAVTAAQPNPQYVAYLVEGNDVGGIDVGFLVKTAEVQVGVPRVTVNEVVQELDGTLFTNPDTSTETLNDRPPLRLAAVIHHPNSSSYPTTGALQVIVNHMRSLNGVADNGAGSNGWPTAGARVRAKRRAQAEDLAGLIQARQTATPGERMILIGDFNAFEVNDGFVDSMGTIRGVPTPASNVVLASTDLVTPDVTRLEDATPAQRYSYVFDGNAQTLDHVLVSDGLVGDTHVLAYRTEHPRIDADFPQTARNDATTATRLSDHDPVVAYFQVDSFPVELQSFRIE
jgi:hypothetical protein